LLELFRKNTLLNNTLLLLYTFCVRAVFIFNRDLPRDPDGGVLFEYVKSLFVQGGLGEVLFATFLIFIQATLLNRICGVNKITRENSLLPGLFLVLLSSLSVSFLALSPIMLANFFLLIAIHNFFLSSKESGTASRIFNTGFFTSVAAFCFQPYLIFLLVFFVGMAMLRSFKWIERIQMLTGIFVPYLLLFIYGFVFDQIPQIITLQWYNQWQIINSFASISWHVFIPFGYYLISLLFGLMSYSGLIFRQNVQARRKINLMYFITLMSGIVIWFQSELRWSDIQSAIIPLAFLMGAFLQIVKNKLLSELIHLIFLSGVLFLHYYFSA
jgi:hypothetical protein